MKCINIYNKAIGLFIILLCLNLISCLERKKIKKVKKVKSIDPNNFAIAVLLTKMGSKLTIQKIVNKLGKKCKNLKILQRTKTSLRWLRNKFGYIRKALRKNKVNENVRQTLYKNFYSRLFNRLLKCTVISGSKAGSQLKKAVKMLKKGKKLPEALKNIRNLVNLTDAKAEPQKGFFHALRKYYKFLERKKQIKKILKQKGPNPIQKNKKSLRNSEKQLKKVQKLGRKIKRRLKHCVMLKGDFSKKACKKVRKIREEMRRISIKLYRKLNKNCKSAKTYCLAKGSQKFCKNAHKICQKTNKIRVRISKSKLLAMASKFGRIVSKLIKNYINKH